MTVGGSEAYGDATCEPGSSRGLFSHAQCAEASFAAYEKVLDGMSFGRPSSARTLAESGF